MNTIKKIIVTMAFVSVIFFNAPSMISDPIAPLGFTLRPNTTSRALAEVLTADLKLSHKTISLEYRKPKVIIGVGKAVKCNNPGNLVYANQPKASKCGRFAKFPTPEDGYKALIAQVRLDQSREFTLSKFIHKYAPTHENDTALYINQAKNALNVVSSTNIKNINTYALAEFIAYKESKTIIK